MKENITKFDLEAAFKALDEIDYPKANKGLKPNKVDLSEMFSKKLRTDILIEDYYNVNDPVELEGAQEEREAEIAKAKLARIEKIVDLDATSEEDLLPSYIGKVIIQCPQCMTLFYKKAEEIEESDTEDLVNIGEKCQHCGNESGYTVIGKVDAVADDELANYEQAEADTEIESAEEPAEEPVESEQEIEDDEIELEQLPSEDEETAEEFEEESEEEKKEESFYTRYGKPLNEEIDADLNKKLEEHNEYIKYLQEQIEKEEKAFEAEKNEFVKASIAECIEALKIKLEEAIPEEIKATSNIEEIDTTEEIETEAEVENESKKEKKEESLTEDFILTEDALPAETEANMEKLLDELDKEPITSAEVERILDQAEDFKEIEEIDEESVNESLNRYLRAVYSNVESCTLTECYFDNNNLILNNTIKFKSGKTTNSSFKFVPKYTGLLEGYNSTLSADKAFAVKYRIENSTKLIIESLEYKYKLNNKLVEGLIVNK